MKIVVKILKKYFFDESSDVCEQLRKSTGYPDHPENYWIQSFEDGRIRCHLCQKACLCRLVESSREQNA